MGVTGNHPFWVKDKGWTESDLLKPGDLVQAKDGGWLKVESLTPRVERATGYNLEVETDHTYFVGNSGAWVHNGSRCYNPLYKEPTRYRVDVRKTVWDNAKDVDGIVIDPNTSAILEEGKWDMGHRPGYSFKQLVEYAQKNNLSRKQFLDMYHNPKYYRPEATGSNRGRTFDIPTNLYP